jgi:hypothetical protein
MKSMIDAIQAKEREVEFRAEPMETVQFSDGWLTINGERFFVTETARRMLAEGLMMPAAFVLQLPSQLQASLFNFMLERTVARARNNPPLFCSLCRARRHGCCCCYKPEIFNNLSLQRLDENF